MSTPKAKIVVMVALAGATLVVACGGGGDAVVTLGPAYEQRAGDFAAPTTSNQDPSPAQKGSAGGVATANPQDANGNGKDGGTSGGTSGASGNTSGGTSGNTSGGTSGNTSGGTSGMPANCPPCDGMFTCDVTLTGASTTKSPITLVTKGGVCVFSSQMGDVTFACGGTLIFNMMDAGTWANCVKTPTGGPPTTPDAG